MKFSESYTLIDSAASLPFPCCWRCRDWCHSSRSPRRPRTNNCQVHEEVKYSVWGVRSSPPPRPLPHPPTPPISPSTWRPHCCFHHGSRWSGRCSQRVSQLLCISYKSRIFHNLSGEHLCKQPWIADFYLTCVCFKTAVKTAHRDQRKKNLSEENIVW